MDSLMSWAKENFDLIGLAVGIAGVVIAVMSLAHELNERQRKQKHSKP